VIAVTNLSLSCWFNGYGLFLDLQVETENAPILGSVYLLSK